MDTLSVFIRGHREQLTAEWMARVRELPSARSLSEPLLRDHVPVMLERIAESVERGDWSGASLAHYPSHHAQERLREGYDLREVVAEYRELRATILAMYREYATDLYDRLRDDLLPLAVMSEAFDRAIADAVNQYSSERDRNREIFLGVLGHDLRNPLQSIAMAAETMLMQQGQALDADAARLAIRVSKSAARMNRMIEDLLDVVRVRLGGGMPIKPAFVHLKIVIDHIVEEACAAYPDRRIEYSARGSGDFVGEWDGDRVSQAVSNLVNNALQHGEDPVGIEIVDDGAVVRVEVRNNGHIAEELIGSLFDPFMSGPTERVEGLGLGLFIVKMVAEAHGGDVTAQSNTEIGTRFTLLLPRQRRD